MNQAVGLGTSEVPVSPWPGWQAHLAEVLADSDEQLLADLVADRKPRTADLVARLATQTAGGRSGGGVRQLSDRFRAVRGRGRPPW